MALGTTIWIKKMYEKYWDTDLKKYGLREILPEILLNTGYADMNFEHIGNLTELSVSAGIAKPLLLKNSFEDKSNFNKLYYCS